MTARNYILLGLIFCIQAIRLSAQSEDVSLPDTFLYKLAHGNIEFSIMGEIDKSTIGNPNVRLAFPNACESVYNFNPDLKTYIGKKKEVKIAYKMEVIPFTPIEEKSKTYEVFLPAAFGLYNSALQEGTDLGTELSIIENLKEDINADLVEIATFKLKEDAEKCLKNNQCLHIMAYKKNHGYINVMVFYNRADFKDIKRILATAIRSLKFIDS